MDNSDFRPRDIFFVPLALARCSFGFPSHFLSAAWKPGRMTKLDKTASERWVVSTVVEAMGALAVRPTDVTAISGHGHYGVVIDGIKLDPKYSQET